MILFLDIPVKAFISLAAGAHSTDSVLLAFVSYFEHATHANMLKTFHTMRAFEKPLLSTALPAPGNVASLPYIPSFDARQSSNFAKVLEDLHGLFAGAIVKVKIEGNLTVEARVLVDYSLHHNREAIMMQAICYASLRGLSPKLRAPPHHTF